MMRNPLFVATPLLLGSLVVQAAAAESSCIHLRDLQALTKISDTQLLAQTRDHRSFIVSLDGACPNFGRAGYHYVVRKQSDWECLQKGIVFEFNYGRPCAVSSVDPKSS